MIKPPILAALNKQILHEQSNAHAYQARESSRTAEPARLNLKS